MPVKPVPNASAMLAFDSAAAIALTNLPTTQGTVPPTVARIFNPSTTVNIRYWVDGSTPTASAGFIHYPLTWLELFDAELGGFKGIPESSTISAPCGLWSDDPIARAGLT